MSNYRKKVPLEVERKLYAESMGRCMNPDCLEPLFEGAVDIGEKAHICAYRDTKDNSFDNLILLCPNCHKKFDKQQQFSVTEIENWKQQREEKLNKLFSVKFSSFSELKKRVAPILIQNREYYENYYLKNKKLWNKVEPEILANNQVLVEYFKKNLDLVQDSNYEVSNREYVNKFITHANEFKLTRLDEEKERVVLFPKEIDSMFGVKPVNDGGLPITESFEEYIRKLEEQGKFIKVVLGISNPYIEKKSSLGNEKIYLNDTPRMEQILFDNKCFRKTKVRFESLNFALSYIRNNGLTFRFLKNDNLRNIEVKGKRLLFVYEYCLSKVELQTILPQEGTFIVNLHNWNGNGSISDAACEFARKINVTLLTMDNFYEFIKEIKSKI